MTRRPLATPWRLALVASTIAAVALAPQGAGAQWRAEPVFGLRFGPPLRAGLAAAVAWGGGSDTGNFAGVLVLVEPAIGGVRGSAGYLLAGSFASGLSVLGSAIRTWGSPAQVSRNRTLVGGELRVIYFMVNAGLGVYRPASGPEDDRRTRYFLNLGLGI